MAKSVTRKNDKKTVRCPVETTIAAIGGRWKVLVIHYLLEGTHRFGELTRLLKGVSARTLTKQLRELEDSGIIDRHVHQQIPPKVEYSLTELGRNLKPVLYAMHDWGEELDKRCMTQRGRPATQEKNLNHGSHGKSRKSESE